MIVAVARFVLILAMALAAAAVAAVASKAHVAGAVVELKTDALVWGRFEVVDVGEAHVGPVRRAPAVYNVTTPGGVVYVAYLPAGTVLNVTDAHVLGVYRVR